MLVHDYTPLAIAETLRRERAAGRPEAEAVAIAYRTARDAWEARHSGAPMPPHLRHGGG